MYEQRSGQNDMATLSVAKRELRRKVREILTTLSHENVVDQSNFYPQSIVIKLADPAVARSAMSTLLSMPEYEAARKIGIYLSMPAAEIETKTVVHDAFRHGKQVFVPYIHKQPQPKEGQPKSIMDMLELHSTDEYESLSRDSWGIPTLPAESVMLRRNCLGGRGPLEGSVETMSEDNGLDMIVMPGSVFDSHMGRVGHGKGYYDFFLQRYKESNDRGPKKGMLILGK